MPYGPQTVFTTFWFFDTLQQCQAFYDSYPGSSPGGGVLTLPAPVWRRTDKSFLTTRLNSEYVQQLDKAGGWYLESPRKFGVNSASERRVSVPSGDFTAKELDFSGAAGLVQFINNLPAYARVLRKERRFRDAGIVLFAYDQVISQKWSITEALAYLRENRL